MTCRSSGGEIFNPFKKITVVDEMIDVYNKFLISNTYFMPLVGLQFYVENKYGKWRKDGKAGVFLEGEDERGGIF